MPPKAPKDGTPSSRTNGLLRILLFCAVLVTFAAVWRAFNLRYYVGRPTYNSGDPDPLLRKSIGGSVDSTYTAYPSASVAYRAPSPLPAQVVNATTVLGAEQSEEEKASAGLGTLSQDLTFNIIVFTCDRHDAVARLFKSLSAADYMGDLVNLDIIIDHCKDKAARDKCTKLALDFQWPHGHKSVRSRKKQVGLKFMWFEAWYPVSPKDIGVIFEDDMEVSPEYYRFMRSVVYKYYLEEFDEKMVGMCLHPWALPKLKERIWKSRYVCSWGAVMFPHAWRGFMDWVDAKLQLGEAFRPLLPDNHPLTFYPWHKVNYWILAKKDVWTSWMYRYMYELNNTYTVTYCLEANCAAGYAVNHQDKGTNYPVDMGTKWALARKPAAEYFPTLPPLSSLVLRLDAKLIQGPCNPKDCPDG
eukprot:jgi/Chlat1/803/Chrsp104S01264